MAPGYDTSSSSSDSVDEVHQNMHLNTNEGTSPILNEDTMSQNSSTHFPKSPQSQKGTMTFSQNVGTEKYQDLSPPSEVDPLFDESPKKPSLKKRKSVRQIFSNLKSMAKEITPWLVIASIVTMGSSFQFGYSIGVTNSPQDAISNCENSTIYTRWIFPDCIPMNNLEWSILVSAQTVGGFIGGITGGTVADFIGRRTTLWLTCAVFLLALWLQALSPNMWVFWIGRFIVGIGAGIASNVSSMYIGEMAPDSVRGGFGVLPQLAVTSGIFVSQFLSIFLSYRPGWRFLMGCPVIPILFQIVLFPFCPESPRWLVNKRRFKSFTRSLKLLRRAGPKRDEEIEQLRTEVENQEIISFRKKIYSLFRLNLVKPLIIGIALSMAQQLSGINVVFYYSTSIFTNAGVEQPEIATAIVGLVNVFSTFGITFVIDLLGRRTLLIIGQSLQIFFFSVLTVVSLVNFYVVDQTTNIIMSWISIVCVVGFVISFSLALGAIPWLILAEIFPDDARAYLSSICVGFNWFSNFLVAICFPFMAEYLKAYCFLPFVVLLILFLVFTIVFVPETKGKMPANAKVQPNIEPVPSTDSLENYEPSPKM